MKPKDRENKLYTRGKRCELSKEEEILLEYLDRFVSPGNRVLDIGCGSGEVTYKIKEKGYDVFGLDFSSVAIELAREYGLVCELADLDDGIPFHDGAFDVVWAGDVIEHVFDPIFVLKEVNRVLVSRGSLLCTVPYDLRLATRIRVLFGRSYQESVYRNFGQYKHHTFFSMPLLRYMLTESCLHVRDMSYVIRLPKSRKRFVSRKRALIYFAETIALRAVANKLSV